jgi:hypothetical protein
VDGLADEVVRLSQCLAVRLAVVARAFQPHYCDYKLFTSRFEVQVLLVQGHILPRAEGGCKSSVK